MFVCAIFLFMVHMRAIFGIGMADICRCCVVSSGTKKNSVYITKENCAMKICAELFSENRKNGTFTQEPGTRRWLKRGMASKESHNFMMAVWKMLRLVLILTSSKVFIFINMHGP